VLARIPVAKTVYSSSKGIVDAISQSQTEAFKRVVLIEYPRKGLYSIAFVTSNARWGQLGEGTADLLLVFLPTTPNPTSGYLLMVPRPDAVDLPITVEEGVRMVISGGILKPESLQTAAPSVSAALAAPSVQGPGEAGVDPRSGSAREAASKPSSMV
jgi:uncharacterized membrane protein